MGSKTRSIVVSVFALLSLALLKGCSSDIIPSGTSQATEIAVWASTADGTVNLRQVSGQNFRFGAVGGDQTITVNDLVQYQQMDGFGASMTESSAMMIISNLNTADRNELMTKLFDRTLGIGISLLRQPMGASDFSLSNWTYDDTNFGSTDLTLAQFSISKDSNAVIPLIKQAQSLNSDLRIMASPWSPPGWMRNNDRIVQGGSLKGIYYSVYSVYFVRFINAYSNIGIPIYAVTVQNETQMEPLSNAGMVMTATEEANFIKNNLGPAIATNGVKPKILCYDHNWDNTNHVLSVMSDSAARAYIAGSAWHSYGGTPNAMGVMYNVFAPYGKDVWFTEGGSGTWIYGDGSYKSCFKDQVQNLIQISRNWSKSVIWWNIALNQNGGPIVYTNTNNYGMATVNTNSRTYSFTSGYYTMGHLSKFVRPNAYRIDSSSDTNNLQSVAFKNTDNSIVLLVYNQASSEKVVRVQWGLKGFTVTMPKESAVTLVWNGN